LSGDVLSAPARPSAVDERFEDFARALPDALREEAARLACTLGLAPAVNASGDVSGGVPWSQVFGHAITLSAPTLVAEAIAGAREAAIENASRAHLFAVIEAFATDRLEDGQVAPSALLLALIERLRGARDEAIACVCAEVGFASASARTRAAIRAEQQIFASGQAASFTHYVAVSLDKQQLGLPASLALARAAGWDAQSRRSLGRMLEAAWMGLQLYDDVIDWEDDLTRGGAWAALLAGVPRGRAADARALGRVIREAGVLARMLRGAARFFRAARQRARVLGAHALGDWAAAQEARMAELAQKEEAYPGFANRAHALSGWARSVLG